jgi:hypothetical protein
VKQRSFISLRTARRGVQAEAARLAAGFVPGELKVSSSHATERVDIM